MTHVGTHPRQIDQAGGDGTQGQRTHLDLKIGASCMVLLPPTPMTPREPPPLMFALLANALSSTEMPAPLSSISLTAWPLTVEGMNIRSPSKNSKSIQPVERRPAAKCQSRTDAGRAKRAAGSGRLI